MNKKNLLNILIVYLVSSFIFLPLVQAQQRTDQMQQRSVSSFGISKTPQSGGANVPNLSNGLPPGLSLPSGTNMPIGAGSTILYNIHVLGEVANPGTYKITPSDRVADAIKYAGGVLPNGSERTIQMRRGDTSQTVDLFSYKYRGNLNANPYLMENDVVFVPVKKGEFEIEGTVNRPGNYEISRTISLKEAVSMAGGFASGLSNQDPIRVVRYNSEEKKQILEIQNHVSDLNNFKIQKGDVVVVPHILLKDKTFDYTLKRIPGDNIFHPTVDDNVYVMGSVIQPGAFPFEPNFTFKEYVSLAGATEKSKMKSIEVVRRNGERMLATSKTIINPGDTVVVHQKYWKAETISGWLSTLASLTLSSILINDRISK